MQLRAYIRACAVVARATAGLAVRAFIAPGRPAKICRHSGRVTPA